MTRRQWILFLLLNVLVSAGVTSAVLFFYDRSHRLDCLPAASASPADLAPASVNLEIVSVVGAGTAETEIVVIQNKSGQSVNLNGWTLKGNSGTAYVFPPFTLPAGGTVQVHTAAGTDTFSDVYWGRSASVWQSGEIAALYDPQGNARAFYKIP